MTTGGMEKGYRSTGEPSEHCCVLLHVGEYTSSPVTRERERQRERERERERERQRERERGERERERDSLSYWSP